MPPPPSKKRKVDHLSSKSSDLERIKELEANLKTAVEENGSLNALADLLSIAKKALEEDKTERIYKSIYALYRVFSLLVQGQRFHGTGEGEVVRKWLVQRLEQYLRLLFKLFDNEEPQISKSALQIPFSLLKSLSSSVSHSSGHPQVHYPTFRLLFPAYLSSDHGVALLIEQSNKYDDLRWFVLRELSGLLRTKEPSDDIIRNSLLLLGSINSMPTKNNDLNTFYITELSKPPKGAQTSTKSKSSKASSMDEDESDDDDWRTYFAKPTEHEEEKKVKEGRASELSTHASLHSTQSHRLQFSYAWLSLLSLIKSNREQSSQVLAILHKRILPYLVDPLQLADWIGSCVDFGGSIALLGLNALFVLMKDHNLDYPSFYDRLYALLHKDILHVRYRARFFRLLELFLSSTHLPATLLASFVKRLSRLSLSAPPPAVIMVIPFTYNTLKRHPSLMGMVHRLPDEGGDILKDPFKPDETSPLLTNAINSSLWELQTHTNHYLAPVSTLARIFSEPFTKPNYSLEDFLDHTYGTLYTSEVKKKIREEPALGMKLDWSTRGQEVNREGSALDMWDWDGEVGA